MSGGGWKEGLGEVWQNAVLKCTLNVNKIHKPEN